MFKISFDTKREREREYKEQSGIVFSLDFWIKFLLSFFLHPARTESDLNAARAGRFVDREKYVELEQDGDGEEDGVDDETDETQGPGEEEPSDQEDDVEQHQTEEQADDGVGQCLGVDRDEPGALAGTRHQGLGQPWQAETNLQEDILL